MIFDLLKILLYTVVVLGFGVMVAQDIFDVDLFNATSFGFYFMTAMVLLWPVFLVDAYKTGEISAKGHSVDRKNYPKAYWFVFLVYVLSWLVMIFFLLRKVFPDFINNLIGHSA